MSTEASWLCPECAGEELEPATPHMRCAKCSKLPSVELRMLSAIMNLHRGQTAPPAPPVAFVQIEDAMGRLGCKRTKITTLLRTGKLQGRKIGARWMVSVDSINAMLSRTPAPRRLPPRRSGLEVASAIRKL